MTPRDAIEFMDDFLDNCLGMDLSTATKFQCMKVLRDALVRQGFDVENANIMACNIQLDVSDGFWNGYQEEITSQLDKLAQLLFTLYFSVEEEFGMDVTTFIQTFAKDMSYKLTED